MIILIIFVLTYIFSMKFSKKSEEAVLTYAKNETTLLSTLVITEAVEEYTDLFKNKNEFAIEQKDSNDKIIGIDFNTNNVNKALMLINKKILDSLKKIEKGELTELNIDNLSYKKTHGNIIYFLPFGIITNNIFLTSLGPRIPLKMNAIGRVTSNIKTEITHYGINSALFKMFIDIEITELILLPFISDKVNVNVSIPVIIRIIEGEVPSVYGTPITSSSSTNALNIN